MPSRIDGTWQPVRVGPFLPGAWYILREHDQPRALCGGRADVVACCGVVLFHSEVLEQRLVDAKIAGSGADLDGPLDNRDAMSWRHAEMSCVLDGERAKKSSGAGIECALG